MLLVLNINCIFATFVEKNNASCAFYKMTELAITNK